MSPCLIITNSRPSIRPLSYTAMLYNRNSFNPDEGASYADISPSIAITSTSVTSLHIKLYYSGVYLSTVMVDLGGGAGITVEETSKVYDFRTRLVPRLCPSLKISGV